MKWKPKSKAGTVVHSETCTEGWKMECEVNNFERDLNIWIRNLENTRGCPETDAQLKKIGTIQEGLKKKTKLTRRRRKGNTEPGTWNECGKGKKNNGQG